MTEALLALLFGLLIGSFLNVCIYRWPRDLSVVKPRSHCIQCENTIAWYDNIPVVSFLLLGGRCRACHARISYRYPIVELATGLLFFYCVYTAGLTLLGLKLCVFSAMLVALIFCDYEERILPDEFTLGGTVVGLVFAAFVPVPGSPNQLGVAPILLGLLGVNAPDRVSWLLEAALGAALPALILWFCGWIYEKVRHREGLGFGDVKLLAMIGAFLGISDALWAFLLGSIAGSVLGIAYIKFTHKEASSYELPFGTFLGLAALVTALTAGW